MTFATTAKGVPYIVGTQNASLIDDWALELANKVDGMTPFATSSGTVSSSATLAAGASTTVAITYPVGRFTYAPITQLTLQNDPANSSYLTVRISANSISGATVTIYNLATTSKTYTGLSIGWLAVQILSTAAAG